MTRDPRWEWFEVTTVGDTEPSWIKGPLRSCGQCGYEPMAAKAVMGGWELTCPDCGYQITVMRGEDEREAAFDAGWLSGETR